MNHSTYIFGELGSGYTQYPDDSTKQLLSLGVNKNAQTSITLCRADSLIYYVYVRNLKGIDKYLGLAVAFNSLYTPSIKALFSCFEECVSNIILSGDILEFNEEGDVVNKNTRLHNQKEAIDKIVRHIDLLIADSKLTFEALPPLNYSISALEQATLAESASVADIKNAILNSNVIRVYKNSDFDSIAIKGFSSRLKKISAEKNLLEKANKELTEELSKVKKQKKQFQVVVILGLILFIGAISLFFMNSSLIEAKQEISSLKIKSESYANTIVSLREQKTICEETIAKQDELLLKRKQVIVSREKTRDSLKTLLYEKADENKRLKSEKDTQKKEYIKLKKSYDSLDEKYKTTYSKLQNALKKSTISSSSVQPYLNYARVTLKIGEQTQLVLKNVNPSQVQGWYSENDKVAYAVSSGIVRGMKRGNTKVWVTYNGSRYYCSVIVK
ncbi:MAG: hypothetical protein IKW11_04160 [Bacteroidales bacterium]|nr:hypothetical protein [Bacteroidales bacterium]